MKKPKGSNKIIVAKTLLEDSEFAPMTRPICLGRGSGMGSRKVTPASRAPAEADRRRFPTIRHVRCTTPGTAWRPAMIELKEIPAEPSLHTLLAMYDKAVRILAESLVPGMNALLESMESPEEEAPPAPPSRRKSRQR